MSLNVCSNFGWGESSTSFCDYFKCRHLSSLDTFSDFVERNKERGRKGRNDHERLHWGTGSNLVTKPLLHPSRLAFKFLSPNYFYLVSRRPIFSEDSSISVANSINLVSSLSHTTSFGSHQTFCSLRLNWSLTKIAFPLTLHSYTSIFLLE